MKTFLRRPVREPDPLAYLNKYPVITSDTPVSKKRHIPESVKAVMALGTAGLALGAIVATNYGIQVDTNHVAQGKAITGRECLATTDHKGVITPDLHECMKNGVPGGNPIDPSIFRIGDAIASVTDYIGMQDRQAARNEIGDTALYSFADVFLSMVVVSAGVGVSIVAGDGQRLGPN